MNLITEPARSIISHISGVTEISRGDKNKEVKGGQNLRDLPKSGMKVKCYHSATQSPQFDVSVPEKLLKIVATRGEIFSLKFTK